MGFLIDTSALIHLLRDKTGLVASRYRVIVGTSAVHLSRVTVFELLKGARDAAEWSGLDKLMSTQIILECDVDVWNHAARLVFDLRRAGLTLKAPVDALIAQTAIKYGLTVMHDDNDFELISTLRPLALERFRVTGP